VERREEGLEYFVWIYDGLAIMVVVSRFGRGCHASTVLINSLLNAWYIYTLGDRSLFLDYHNLSFIPSLAV
jgi:hypothetical protein